MSAKAIQLIERCLDSLDPYLDLGNCGLTMMDVAPDTTVDLLLRQCKHIQTLILSSTWTDIDIHGNWIENESSNIGEENNFNNYPPAIKELTELSQLICAGKVGSEWYIDNLESLENLTNLCYLNVSYNMINEIKGLERLTNLQQLSLHCNKIGEITGLDKLKNLTFLDIGENQIKKISGLDNLKSLKVLDISENKISEISGLDCLQCLKELHITHNEISEIKGLNKLESLRILKLYKNKISKLKGIDDLVSLQILDLSENNLTEINGLENVSNLIELDLCKNKIQQIDGLEMLVNLKYLNLELNNITKIQNLNCLISLEELDLTNNKIKNIEGLENLTNLTSLDLSRNEITEIKNLDKLISLKVLAVNANEIKEIKGLEELSNLKRFYARHNKINEIRGIKNIVSLTNINLSNNQIQNIEPLLPFLTKKKNPLLIATKGVWERNGLIDIKGNPITIPPQEIVNMGNKSVIRYFAEDLEMKFEAKILIVGEPEAGKTSLMKKIISPNYQIPVEEDSTIGIQVVKWICKLINSPKSINVNIWDFGGQEMQYLTHQFFLSSDALYLLLTSARKDYDNLDYWFNIITLLGKNESDQNSELLVIANEINMPQGQVNKLFDAKKYQNLYPHLPFSFHQVNLASIYDNDGRFNTIVHNIQKKLLQLPILGKQLPIKWGLARKILTDLNVNYVSINQYLSICASVNIDEKLALDLSNYLHKIGEIVHFQNDFTVGDYVILNPKWAVDGVYSILKRQDIQNEGGHFTQQQVYNIWDEKGYLFAERNLLLSLMVKDSFEVAYKIPGKRDEYIAPQLLSLNQPQYSWNKTGAIQFLYFYPFMPKGILTRLIVRMHESIKYENNKGLVWRTGAILEKNACIAKIEETKIVSTGQQVIAIEIIGMGLNRKLLLYDICKTIESIHQDSFAKISFERQIPCNCEHCINLDKPGFFNYSELIEYLNEGLDKIRCKLKVKNEPLVKSLLRDIFDVDFTKLTAKNTNMFQSEQITQDLLTNPFAIKINRKKKIFISYSHKDTKFTLTNGVLINFKDELEIHLKSLKRLGLADSWSDTNLLAGEDWDLKIKSEIDDADIILFLVSANLIGTDYVWNEEMPLAKYNKENKKSVLIPIILNECQWTSISLFSENNALPQKGKPISSYNNRENAYNEIVTKIKNVLEQ